MLIRLNRYDDISIRGNCRGILIRCEEGVLWITQTGDPNDHILTPNREFIIRRRGLVIVEALQDARLVTECPDGMTVQLQWLDQPRRRRRHGAIPANPDP